MEDSGTSIPQPGQGGPGAPALAAIDPSALLRALAEAVEHDFCLAISPNLQLPLEARAQGLAQCTLGEFLNAVEEPTCCLPLTVSSPCDAPPLVEISPQIAFGLIDRLLGGSVSESYVPTRPLTAIEGRLLKRLCDSAAACLTRHWPWAQTTAFLGAGDAMEPPADGMLAQPVVVAKFSLTMSRHAGALRLCVPASLAPLMGNAAADGLYQRSRRGSAPLEVSAVIQDEGMSAEELAALARGDILVTDTASDGEVIVRVAGIPKFYGRLASVNGRRAIRITRRILP